MPRENRDTADSVTPRKFGGRPMKSIIIILAIMLFEGGMFAAWMVFDGPIDAEAGTGEMTATVADSLAETVVLDDGRAPNRRSGRLYMYDIQISIETDKESIGRVKGIRDQREAFIRDRLRTIVARAEPNYFDEPDLQTLKRQIGGMLDDVFGENTIKQVLIPKCTGYAVE